MIKTLEKHNSHQIYIREPLKPLWIKFLQLIRKDPEIIKLRDKSRSGVISIAIMNLILKYVQENEASNQDNN